MLISHALFDMWSILRLTCALLFCVASASVQAEVAPSVVRAASEAAISSIIPGTIKSLPFEEGRAFAKGDVLAVLDCAIYQAEANAANAQSDGALATLVSSEALRARGGIGRTELDVARAASVAAKAKADAALLLLRGCKVTAPYDGRIAEVVVNEFEYVETSQPILSIVSIEVPHLEIIAPAKWLRWLKIGTKGQVEMEAVEGLFSVSITATGPVVDPVSRTVKIRAEFDDYVPAILPGMSGLVSLEERP